MKQASLSKNASNRITLSTASYWQALKISLLLKFKYRFKRTGRYIRGLDEVIYRNYVKNDLIINSSWDIWFGYDFSADNEITDAFLTKFFNTHLND